MATWENLDNESESEKYEAEEEGKVAMRLVPTTTSDAESGIDSEDEDEVYSKLTRYELIESMKELTSHFQTRSKEINDLKEKYVNLKGQHEKTLLDLKQLEEYNESYDFIVQNYEKKLTYIFLKLNDKCNEKPLSKQEIVEDFIMTGIDRSNVASMIYGIHKNNGEGIGFTEGKPNVAYLKSCSECFKEGLKTYFVSEADKTEVVI